METEFVENEQVSPVVAGSSEEEEPEMKNGYNMMNPSVAEIVLYNTLGFLDTVDIIRASKVCRMWHSIASKNIFWREIKTKNCRIVDMEKFLDKIKEKGTVKLDLRGILCPLYSPASPPNFWVDLFTHLKSVKTIISLDLGICPAIVTHLIRLGHLTDTVKYLTMRFESGSGFLVDLSPLEKMRLIKLNISSWCETIQLINAHCLSSMDSVEMFSLSTWSSPYATPPFGLGRMLFKDFALYIVPRMVNLRKLTLCDRTSVYISNHLISAISKLKHLVQLDLINCNVDVHFEASLAKCTRLKRLTIAPTNFNPHFDTSIPVNIHQQIVSAAYGLRETLDYFRLGIYEKNMKGTKEYVKYDLGNVSYVRYVHKDEDVVIPIVKQCECKEKPCPFEYHIDFLQYSSLRILLQSFGKCRTEVIKIRLPAPQFEL